MNATAFKPNQPVFFKKLPATEKTPTNAEVKRYLGIVDGEPAIEIVHGGNKWIVRESECLSVDEALHRRAEYLNKRIATAKSVVLPDDTKKNLAAALGICESTLRRWYRLINAFMRKPEPELDPKTAKDVPLK